MTVQKKTAALTAVFMLFVFFAPRVYANGAEPPSFVIYSVNAPSDTEIVYTYGGEDGKTVKKSLRLWEKVWFLYDRAFFEEMTLTVRSSEKSFELALPEDPVGGSFKDVYTLDFAAETLTENVSPLRAPVYMLLRVIFTLVIECGFYLLVGYRQKRSFIAFAAVNLVTQMFVNFVINGGSLEIFTSYKTLVYFGMELAVFIFEMIVLTCAVKEKKKWQTCLLTAAANYTSMIIGGIALLFVPF